MPELPDILAYVTALRREFQDQPLRRLDIKSPFVMRTVEPPITAVDGQRVTSIDRSGKRLVWSLENGLVLVVHLMIAGRFHQRKPQTLPRGKNDLAAFQFDEATLMLTEASPKKRTSLHLLARKEELAAFDRAGLDVTDCTYEQFAERLQAQNHTVKRALTDPRILDGIGNAYSDEILHRAQLAPMKWTERLSDDELHRLFDAARQTLAIWTDRLCQEAAENFPERVTAFRAEMAVHGKFGQPCPECQTAIQRIRYADRETNYCPACQTDGKILADRSLSRLLKGDWPKTLDELEA